jgi:hypothetical protein
MDTDQKCDNVRKAGLRYLIESFDRSENHFSDRVHLTVLHLDNFFVPFMIHSPLMLQSQDAVKSPETLEISLNE